MCISDNYITQMYIILTNSNTLSNKEIPKMEANSSIIYVSLNRLLDNV